VAPETVGGTEYLVPTPGFSYFLAFGKSIAVHGNHKLHQNNARTKICTDNNELELWYLDSIMQRAKVLGRGLADRVPAVQTECVHLLETWLTKDCEGDGVALLRYLDVQTHEKVGEAVLLKALKEGMIKMKEGDSLRQFFQSPDVHTGQCNLGGRIDFWHATFIIRI
jgi:hypothetical protein